MPTAGAPRARQPRAADGCVSLRVDSELDSQRLGPAVTEFMRGLNPQRLAGVTVESVQKHGSVKLLTEPDTLLPHRIEVEENTEIVLQVGTERRVQRNARSQRKTYRYIRR